jgi:hypothetical protein
MLNTFQMLDAQVALGFLVEQTSSIEAQVWRQPLADITYQDIIPVDYSANPWATSVTFYSMEGYGNAQWFNATSYDIPNADVKRSQFQTPIYMAAVGYEYNIEEISQAAMLGMNLTSDKAFYARRAFEEFSENIAFQGDATKGFNGLINYPTVTATAVTGGTWQANVTAGTVQNIITQINTALTGIVTGTNTVSYADTILLPVAHFNLLANTPVNAVNSMSLLEWILRYNSTTASTGRPITIRMMRQLDNAGAGGTDRMLVYRRSPEVLKMHIPMPLRFFAPQQIALTFKVPGIFRLGGLDIRRPLEVAYWDGI